MNRISRFLGNMCDECRFCQYARQNPQTPVGKFMAWHGKWCPAWKAQRLIEKERAIQNGLCHEAGDVKKTSLAELREIEK